MDLKELHRKEVYDQVTPLNILKQVSCRAMHEGFSCSSDLKSFYLEQSSRVMIRPTRHPLTVAMHSILVKSEVNDCRG